jgi:AbrB family transcriptional regulator, transcriptional pleiotropic regulator of transition state genes
MTQRVQSDTGVGRKVDDLGRLVLPAELRRSFDIREGDILDITVDGDQILLTKRRDSCTFCSSRDSLRKFREHQVCSLCLTELRRI